MNRLQQSKHALGSTAYITIVDETDASRRVFEDLWKIVDEFEQRFSRFIETSELTQFNAAAGHRRAVSPEFYNLLKAARDLSLTTDGLYNPFILPALQRAGYKGSWPLTSDSNQRLDYSDRSTAHAEDINLETDSATIPRGTAIDFGGIGKGYLLDELADFIEKQGIYNYWLSLGGDIICTGRDSSDEPWRIGIQDVTNEADSIGYAKGTGDRFAVATSGVTKRKGSDWHHIIDPRTSKPALTDVMTASVITESGATADVMAKCFVIAGSKMIDALSSKIGIDDILLQTDGTQNPTIIQKGTRWSN